MSNTISPSAELLHCCYMAWYHQHPDPGTKRRCFANYGVGTSRSSSKTVTNSKSYLNNKQSSNSINSWQLLPHWHISWCTWHVLYIQVQLHGMMYNYTRNYTHNYTRMMYMARSRDPDRLHYTHNVYIVHTKCILHTTCHVYRASLTPPTNHHWHLNRIRIKFTAQPQT